MHFVFVSGHTGNGGQEVQGNVEARQAESKVLKISIPKAKQAELIQR